MKRIRIILSYYKGNLPSVIFISLGLLCILLFFIFRSGNASMLSESMKMYGDSDLKNGIYFMPAADRNTLESDIGEEEIYKFSATKDVIYFYHSLLYFEGNPEKIVNEYFYLETAIDAFNLSDEGRWFSEQSEEELNSTINVVVCGSMFEDVKIGDDIEFTEPGSGKRTTMHVIGKKGNAAMLPRLGSSAMNVSTKNLSGIHENTIISRAEDIPKIMTEEAASYNSPLYGCFIRLKDNASDSEINELKEYLTTMGGYNTYDDIMEYSQKEYLNALRSELAMPLLLLLIFLFAFVATFVLILSRKSVEMRAYYLCGYSKRRCFADFFVCMLIVTVIPCIICTLFIFRFSPIATDIALYLVWGDSEKIIAAEALLLLGGYMLVCIFLSLLLAVYFMRKNSVIEIYRREL